MGQVEEFWDNLRLRRFLAGQRESPFSDEDIRQAKGMGIDMDEEFLWWPAICHQFKIEFGVEMETRFGGNIANLMYSIHALVRREKLNAMAEGAERTTVRPATK